MAACIPCASVAIANPIVAPVAIAGYAAYKLSKGKKTYLAMEGCDGSKKNWRKELYCNYKAKRPKNPDLGALFKYISKCFNCLW